MPKVKTCEATHKGATFKAHLNVNSVGVFSIAHPGDSSAISGPLAEEVEAEWRKAVRDLVDRTKVERKVLVVRFDSILRVDGKKEHFTSEETTLLLECAIALEVTTTQGGKTTVAYTEHPDYSGFHGAESPFPFQMRLAIRDVEFHSDSCTVVTWSLETEAMLVRACNGILAVVEMLDQAFATPESLLGAASSLKLLPSPKLDAEIDEAMLRAQDR